ncbi:MAG TPA: copper resistance protein NlpE [Thermoanaerobaculia bacterium]
MKKNLSLLRAVPAVAAACLLLACEARREPDRVIEAPSTYTGLLPCADCLGVRLTLALQPDGTFQLWQTYLRAGHGLDRSFVHQGRWSLARDAPRLILDGGPEEIRQLAVQGPRTLRVLSPRGKEIDSPFNYDLQKIETKKNSGRHASRPLLEGGSLPPPAGAQYLQPNPTAYSVSDFS